MKPIIEVSGISKSYSIKHADDLQKSYGTFKDGLSNLINRKQKTEKETFWALKDINFTLNQGDALGIIGKNGSGKSTLLKILSRIVDPTEGSIKMRGRVASLLEVGTGFHPELTGRENIFFNGSMIGMSRKEIVKKFDEIVAFSEIEKFIDTPVKFYSSGMYVRLAFAVAAHLEPDILILDEVLAVGDAQFQKKSMSKMTSILREGKTLIFVSHSMQAVEQLCDKALLLVNGKIKYFGETEFAADEYLGRSLKLTKDTKFELDEKKDAQFIEISILDGKGERTDALQEGENWSLKLNYKVIEKCKNSFISAQILDHEGRSVFLTADSDYKNIVTNLEPGTYEALIHFNKFHFMPGIYYLQVSIQTPGKVVHDLRENIPIKIRKNQKDIRLTYYKGKYFGSISDKIEWQIRRNND